MQSWIIPLVVVVVVFDAVLLWWIFTKRRLAALGGMTFLEFRMVSTVMGAAIRDHMQANYSGNPADLPEVLPDLLGRVQSRLMEKGVRLERPMLKRVVAQMITIHKLADPREVENAMKHVA